MTELFRLYIRCYDFISVSGGKESVNMVLFDGEAKGGYFNGKVLQGGVDTQRTANGGNMYLSARYMLEGTDINGENCRVFVENCGDFENGFTPKIVTDSKALAELAEKPLKALLDTKNDNPIITFILE